MIGQCLQFEAAKRLAPDSRPPRADTICTLSRKDKSTALIPLACRMCLEVKRAFAPQKSCLPRFAAFVAARRTRARRRARACRGLDMGPERLLQAIVVGQRRLLVNKRGIFVQRWFLL